jgi:dienelactone hydrolase
VRITNGGVTLLGELRLPDGAKGVVLFAHGSGSGRLSPRNTQVAALLAHNGFGSLLIDLLTEAEAKEDSYTMAYRFDVRLLAERLQLAADWLSSRVDLPFGYYGASTGAAAALIAVAERPKRVKAVVSRGGRPDLASDSLPLVKAPTLLIVGGHDPEVIELNKTAMTRMRAVVKLEVVPGATHLFEEPGKLEVVAKLASEWFERYLHT